ncbi:hypothetical protein [Clavibacter sp. VKM Ac-2542]|uniref:hypothetical protein n=1 Tax=Clavibacter sp. VKM Ac-2542 TaxID=2783811 RepID=UPI00188B6B59|nr:hypothetical protein [Clavibacter sp. VKM Ac-2542]MBF4621326.1 hypothetical protein [Clavibacter sp. VKM Ac-2542]
MEFVNSIVLPDVDEGWRSAQRSRSSGSLPGGKIYEDGAESAAVVAGSLLSFTQNLRGQPKSDVMNSTLLAQLASDKLFDRSVVPMDWYKNYIYVLGRLGWNIPSFSFQDYNSDGTTVNMDQAVISILSAIASGGELGLVSATMGGLNGLADDSKQMGIWDSKASSGKAGAFQIAPVDQLENEDVVMLMTGMSFTAHESHRRFLWWSWSSNSIEVRGAANRFVLNEGVYSRVRVAVEEKLGDNAVLFVDGIEV